MDSKPIPSALKKRCEECGAYVSNLRRHAAIHTSRLHRCDKCNFSTKSQDSLWKHLTNRHTDDALTCKECGKSHKDPTALDKHLKAGHLTCQDCPFITADTDKLSLHRRSHLKEKMFKCDTCPYTTNFKPHLKQHKARKTGALRKSIECELCSYATDDKSNLKKHVARKHQQEGERLSSGALLCDKCPFTANNLDWLERHARIEHCEIQV